MSHPSSLRRIGAIGDIHAEHHRLELALCYLRDLSPDLILAVGDVVDGLGDVEACRSLLDAPDVRVVRGNHERWLLADEMRDLYDATILSQLSAENHHWLQSLPSTLRFDTVAGELLLCHGLGENDVASVKPGEFSHAVDSKYELHDLLREPTLRIVVNGHTHRRMVRSFGALVVVNAGTLYRFEGSGFLWLDFEARRVSMFDLRLGKKREVKHARDISF
jgi:predicted phosphodiesterase